MWTVLSLSSVGTVTCTDRIASFGRSSSFTVEEITMACTLWSSSIKSTGEKVKSKVEETDSSLVRIRTTVSVFK